MKFWGIIALVFLSMGCSNSYVKNYDNELDKVLAVREKVGEEEFEAHKDLYEKDLQLAYLAAGMGNEAAEATRPADIYPSPDTHGNVNGSNFPKGHWALTFDDGPHPVYTPEIMEILNIEKFPTTFFWLAQNMEYFPKPVAEAGHTMFLDNHLFFRALHSFTHAHFSKLDTAGLYKEIIQAKGVFEKVVGEPPTLFRCPYGDCGTAARKTIAKENMIHVMWNVDSLDWADHDPQSIFLRVKKQMILEGRGIILMHDIHPQTVQALKKVLVYVKENNLKIVSVKDAISDLRGRPLESP